MGELNVIKLGPRFCWYDTGTAESMFQASEAVRDIQHKHRRMVGCLEAVAYKKGFIDRDQLIITGDSLKMTEYGRSLLRLAYE